jgi:hypothetical protein
MHRINHSKRLAVRVIVLSFLTLALLTVAFFALQRGLEKHEIIECNKWAEQSRQYELWYATDWQKSQCSHYGITVD